MFAASYIQTIQLLSRSHFLTRTSRVQQVGFIGNKSIALLHITFFLIHIIENSPKYINISKQRDIWELTYLKYQRTKKPKNGSIFSTPVQSRFRQTCTDHTRTEFFFYFSSIAIWLFYFNTFSPPLEECTLKLLLIYCFVPKLELPPKIRTVDFTHILLIWL